MRTGMQNCIGNVRCERVGLHAVTVCLVLVYKSAILHTSEPNSGWSCKCVSLLPQQICLQTCTTHFQYVQKDVWQGAACSWHYFGITPYICHTMLIPDRIRAGRTQERLFPCFRRSILTRRMRHNNRLTSSAENSRNDRDDYGIYAHDVLHRKNCAMVAS